MASVFFVGDSNDVRNCVQTDAVSSLPRAFSQCRFISSLASQRNMCCTCRHHRCRGRTQRSSIIASSLQYKCATASCLKTASQSCVAHVHSEQKRDSCQCYQNVTASPHKPCKCRVRRLSRVPYSVSTKSCNSLHLFTAPDLPSLKPTISIPPVDNVPRPLPCPKVKPTYISSEQSNPIDLTVEVNCLSSSAFSVPRIFKPAPVVPSPPQENALDLTTNPSASVHRPPPQTSPINLTWKSCSSHPILPPQRNPINLSVKEADPNGSSSNIQTSFSLSSANDKLTPQTNCSEKPLALLKPNRVFNSLKKYDEKKQNGICYLCGANGSNVKYPERPRSAPSAISSDTLDERFSDLVPPTETHDVETLCPEPVLIQEPEASVVSMPQVQDEEFEQEGFNTSADFSCTSPVAADDCPIPDFQSVVVKQEPINEQMEWAFFSMPEASIPLAEIIAATKEQPTLVKTEVVDQESETIETNQNYSSVTSESSPASCETEPAFIMEEVHENLNCIVIPESTSRTETESVQMSDCISVMFDDNYYSHKFKLFTRRLLVFSKGDMTDFVIRILGMLLNKTNPTDRVALSVESVYFANKICDFSFMTAKSLTVETVLEAIQCGDSNEKVLSHPIVVTFHCTTALRSRGRAEGTHVDSYTVFVRRAKGVVQVARRDDNLCLARALTVVVAKQNLKNNPQDTGLQLQWSQIRQAGRRNQSEAAVALMDAAGVLPEECSSSIEKFQAVVPYRIVVFRYDGDNPTVVYSGNILNQAGEERDTVFLLRNRDHFDAVLKPNSLFTKETFCTVCFRALSNKEKHDCVGACGACGHSSHCKKTTSLNCADCLRTFRSSTCLGNHKVGGAHSVCKTRHLCKNCHGFVNMTGRTSVHQCNEVYCGICNKHMSSNHWCFMTPLFTGERKLEGCLLIFWHLETLISKRCTNKQLHDVVVCVAQKVCYRCIGTETVHCFVCGKREYIFKGENVIRSFFNFVIGYSGFQKVLCICHHMRGFDSQWILKYMIERGFKPDILQNGTQIMRLNLGNNKYTFLDSINYIPHDLSEFPDLFKLPRQTGRGYFPHYLFKTVPHEFAPGIAVKTNYVASCLPPAEAYGVEFMSSEQREVFLTWYETNKLQTFNYIADIIKYSSSSVSLLRVGCLKYRDAYRRETNTDPFLEGSTISSICLAIFKKNYLNYPDIGVLPSSGYRQNQFNSVAAVQWVAWVEHSCVCNLQTLRNSKVRQILGLRVDGFDHTEQRCFIFHDCFLDACPTCYKDRTRVYQTDPSQNLQSRFEATVHKISLLRTSGYEVTEMWECLWKKEIRQNPELRRFLQSYRIDDNLISLDPRDAHIVGRTEVIKPYHCCEPNQEIRFQDHSSIYPWVCKYGKYPIGHPKVYLEGDPRFPSLWNSEGLLKCTVLPPRGLFLPVLPLKIGKNVYFTLCRTCATLREDTDCNHSDQERQFTGTWVTDEIKKAVQVGYWIVRSFELWQYETKQYNMENKNDGVFSKYIDKFLKMRVYASGWSKNDMSKKEMEEFKEDYRLREGIDIDPDQVEENRMLKDVAELSLHSLWEKFGQTPDFSQTEIIYEPERLYGLLLDEKVTVESVLPVNKDLLLAKWKYNKDIPVLQKSANVVLAVYTAAQARLELYAHLEALGTRLLYVDNKSIFYTKKPNEMELPTGNHLGQMTNGLSSYGEGAFVSEFAACGPKNYGFRISAPYSNVSTDVKFSSIQINSLIMTFDKMKATLGIVGDTSNDFDNIAQQSINSKKTSKTYSVVSDQRHRTGNFNTLPWGY